MDLREVAATSGVPKNKILAFVEFSAFDSGDVDEKFNWKDDGSIDPKDDGNPPAVESLDDDARTLKLP
jgi:hypothetical protein